MLGAGLRVNATAELVGASVSWVSHVHTGEAKWSKTDEQFRQFALAELRAKLVEEEQVLRVYEALLEEHRTVWGQIVAEIARRVGSEGLEDEAREKGSGES